MSKKPNYKQLLIDLKEKLDQGEMSTLVGAGFSKNIDLSFPDWAELIHQMVLYSEETRFQESFVRLYPSAKLNSDNYHNYLRKQSRKYIEQIGPLKAVSDYIRLKGYREAVDFLIEQQTPVIELFKGKRRLRSKVAGKTRYRFLTNADIVCHTKLVDLPWNNIFTTNYDNLLEICVDINSKNDVKKEIVKLEKKIRQTLAEEKALKNKIKNAEAELDSFSAQLIIEEVKFGPGSPEALLIEAKIKELNGSIQELNGKIKFQKYFLQWDLPRLRDLNDIQRSFRTTVAHSADLALKKNQNIIKIHGSIRLKSSEPYGFDGDGAKNYVISQQDYDSYGEKHEAFMQLMRITLLQESFCLFGFSGDDPNFLGWIKWVRDVLQKKAGDTKVEKKEKIYMIDVWGESEDAAKAMFNLNHQIAFIPLQNKECIGFLEEVTGKKVAEDSPKARISLLLDYLSADVPPGNDKISFEVLKQNEYQGLWEGFPLYKLDRDKLVKFLGKTERILALKTFNRLPILFGMTDSNQIHFLTAFGRWYKEIQDDRSLVKKLLQLSLLMLKEVYLPASKIFGAEISEFEHMLKVSEEFPDLHDQFRLIELIDAVWSNDQDRFDNLFEILEDAADEELQQELQYQKTLLAFYNFDFETVLKTLNAWIPIGHWAMKKAGLQSQIAIPDAIETLRASELTSVQEVTYKYHILSYMYAANDDREKGDQQYKLVRAIEKSNLKSFSHLIKRLSRSLKAKPEKLVPYGHEKFTVVTAMFSSQSTLDKPALQLLTVLLETGHPLRLTYVTHLSTEEAYEPLQLAANWYPEVVLFFALQYSEEKFLTRIAQDLIYQKHHGLKITLIANKMMDAYFNPTTPWRLRQSMLVVLAEFIHILEPDAWKTFYLKVWDEEIKQNFLRDDIRRRKQDFLTKGLALILDTRAAEEIIETLLEHFLNTEDKMVKDNVIHFLYQFSMNDYLNERVKGTGLNIKNSIFNELIERLKTDVFFLFALGNISFSFHQDQLDQLKRTLVEMNAFTDANPRLWRVILFFGDGDFGIESRVKQGILKSNSVWHSGIDLSTTTLISSRDSIKLSALREYRNGKSLRWETSELKTLFEQMTAELDKIYNWPRYDDHSYEFSDLIKEMRIFLTTEESALKTFPGYEDARKKLEELSEAVVTGKQEFSAILGADKSAIINEIEELSEEIYKKKRVGEHLDEIEALLYKLLLQKEPALPATLIAIANWFYHQRRDPVLRGFKKQLELALKVMWSNVAFDIDLPSLEEHLIKIAVVLKEWGSEPSLIEPVLDLLKNSRFNAIKYNLNSALKDQ